MPQAKGGRREVAKRPKLGELLLRHGAVTIEQVHDALRQQKVTGKRLGRNLVRLGHLDENTLAKILASQLQLAAANLNKMEIPVDVQKLVPLEVMLESGVLPVKMHENTLYLGVTDPDDENSLKQVSVPAGVKLALVALPQSQWEYAMDFFHRHGWGRKALAKGEIEQVWARGDYDLAVLMEDLVARGGSDIHLSVGSAPTYRVHDQLVRIDAPPLTPARMEELVFPHLTPARRERFAERSEIDFAISSKESGRFRVNLYRMRGNVTAALRHVPAAVPGLSELGLPPWLFSFVSRKQGLILVTGPSGHGKTTTLASLVEAINTTRRVNIVTLEDPVEFVHEHKLSNVNQREVGSDTASFGDGLRHILRQDPDVIVIGEMRDPESFATALAAAETGHLVLATLHTLSATATVDRIIDAFPGHQQNQARHQLADGLLLVFSQRLVPRADGTGRILAYEKLTFSHRVANAIREKRLHLLRSHATRAGEDFAPLEASLADLVRRKVVRHTEALKYVEDEKLYETLVRR